MTPYDMRSTLAIAANNLIGAGTGQLAVLFHPTAHLLSNQMTLQVGAGSATAVSGAYRLATGTAPSTIVQAGIGHDAASFATGFRTGQAWYVFGRFAVNTAVTAQTRAFVGLCDSAGTPSMNAGVTGATSTGFFSLVGTSGAPIITTIPVDTLQHTHEAWRVGGTTFYRIDGGSLFTGSADIGSASGSFAQVFNGTDSVNRSMDLVFYGGACPFV